MTPIAAYDADLLLHAHHLNGYFSDLYNSKW